MTTLLQQDPAQQAPGGPAAPAPRPRRGLSAAQLREALPGALRKLDPRVMWHNPVMFVVEAGAVLTTLLAVAEPFTGGPGSRAARPRP